jgi:hypothetical protein
MSARGGAANRAFVPPHPSGKKQNEKKKGRKKQKRKGKSEKNVIKRKEETGKENYK